ncbi:MAG: TetR/AcrR family transcriptional regulator [Deltaproteobacteria bacterium]|nr:TetR/AcrR family transcriptional regulator [Deltaproteobacteria bacterium]
MTKQNKREDIIHAAMTLLSEQGFHGAPMSTIAEKAGVGVGSIYRYFESRDVLIKTIYKEEEEELVAFLLEKYPYGHPVKECFFHIGTGLVDYFIGNPMDFKFSEQFHNSPYGEANRRDRIFASTGRADIFMELYKRGISMRVFKNMPPTFFFNLMFAPIMWSVRDHILGMVQLDKSLARLIVASCWDSVKS